MNLLEITITSTNNNRIRNIVNKDTCTWKYGNLKIQNEQELQNSHIYYNSIHFEVTLWNITTSYCQSQGMNRFETYPISYQKIIHSNKSRVVVFSYGWKMRNIIMIINIVEVCCKNNERVLRKISCPRNRTSIITIQ